MLYARPFDIPLVSLLAPQQPSASRLEPVVHTDQEVTLILPYLPDAVKARVLRPYGVRALTTVRLGESNASARSIAPLPESRAIPVWVTGDELDRLTILFLGDKYGAEANFQSDVTTHAARFRAAPPVDGHGSSCAVTCVWGSGNCFEGCTTATWFRRSHSHCAMNSASGSGSSVFGPACAPRAKSVIDQYYVATRSGPLLRTPSSLAPEGSMQNAKPTYVWTTSRGALEYGLRVRDRSTRKVVVRRAYEAAAACSAGTDRCRAAPEIVLAPGTYRWWARVINAAGHSDWRSADFTIR